MKARKKNLLMVLFILPFLFLNILTNDARGASIDPNNPTLLEAQNYYTTWSPFNSSHYYQAQFSQSGWYVLGFNSSIYIDSLKFSTQSDYSATEFQHPTITNWQDGFVLWDHDENIDKYINITREDPPYGSGEYSAHIRKSEAISFYTFYEDPINKIKYSAYTLGGDVFMDYYLGVYLHEVQLIGGHTYEIGYDISTSGSENVAISIIIFKESGGFLYGSLGGDNAEVWSGGNAKVSSFQPSITATYLIVSYQYPSNEFIPSEFHIYDTSENLWEDTPPPGIPGYSILILGLMSISTIFLLTKKFKS